MREENLWRDIPYHCQMTSCKTCDWRICEKEGEDENGEES